MDKKILKERLDEVKKQLRTNAKDVHFFDKLIDEALSLKGQMTIEPIVLDGGKEEDEWMGDTFRITLTNKGILYHEYGGYSVFVTPQIISLYETLYDLVVNKEKYAELKGEDEANRLAMLEIIAYNLSIPRLAFLDLDFACENAKRSIDFIKKTYEALTNEPLAEETIEEDEMFKKASLGLEEMDLL